MAILFCFALDPAGLSVRLRRVSGSGHNRVVLFDGVCNLCSAWTRFLIKHDPEGRFKLCSIQSVKGQEILVWAGLSPANVNTMVYVQDGRALLRSSAFLGIMKDLGFPWSLLGLFSIVPRGIRDFLYNRVAENRYRLFGRSDQCMMPSPEHRARFIDSI